MSSQSMTDETPAKRKARLALDRKRAQRKREKDKKLAMGAVKFKMEMYSGTQGELEHIRVEGEFNETDHALTMVIHGVAELARRDPTAFRALIKGREK
ncbi:hypothetical protein KTQ74_07255 [Pseudomonas chlororaphis]|uniref:hypothetical protein n=1 Tax=Pseudomonas chlororaphis TaxID=587753 RepID=UPI001E37CBCD|nr:hypothetical protein [Pseudomonas chlororaphis]MCB2251684.1 hypothetical protein [Pseudomonas chlororaphis]